MLYYTPVDISKPPKTISHQDPIVFFGSCFSTYIAQKLKWYLFNVLDNPFGILYNPSSIEQCILIIKEKKEIKAEHFFLEDDIYKSFYFHSQWAHTNLEFLLDKVNKMILDSHQFLLQSKWVFVTLGTAYVYELKENNQVVANCHKQNAQMFNHRMLSVEEVVDKLNKIYTYILDLSPNANIVFTVSPVRYLKQGAHLNQISKSTLLLAIDALLSKYQQAYYFPSYEIFMDELRDYRYYANDMLHPSELGIEHVWNRFSQLYFDDQTQDLNKQIKTIKTALEHRPLFPESKSYIRFQNQLEQKIKELKAKAPYLHW